MHVYHRNRSALVTFQQHDDSHGHTPSYYPKDQCSGPRHCRYVRPGHLHPRPALSSPPPSAWNGPPDHQLKKIFRCAGRQVKLLLWRRLCFRREGAPQKGREFVQKAPLAELVPQCSIAPSSSRAGQSCSSFLCPDGTSAEELRLPALSCRMSAHWPSLRSWLLRRHAPSCSLACTR